MPELHPPEAEDAALKLALSIADRTPVDWAELSHGESSGLPDWCLPNLEQLDRIVEGHRALHSDAPAYEERAAVETLLTEARRTSESSDLLQVNWGPLVVREKVGHGSFGDVYRAWDPKLEREVALKLVPTTTATRSLSTAFDEGRRLARVRHPNVVSVYGVEQVEGRIGLWMEFIEGPTLADEVTAGGRLEPGEAVRVGIDVCRALSAVHSAGLLHRDVKAQNVMRDLDGRVVLGDFGTGRELATGPDGHLAGTPLYLAPEVLTGGQASTASDQYSVGVLLYYLVTGDYPVGGDNLAAIRESHTGGARVSLAERLPDAPRPFIDIVDRVLEPDPNERYDGVADLGGALAAFVDSQSANRSAAALDTASTATNTRWWLAGSLTFGLVVVGTWLFQSGMGPESGQSGSSLPAARRVSAGTVPMMPITDDFRYFGCKDQVTQDLALCELFDDDFRQVRRVTNRTATGDDASYRWGAFSPDGLEVAYVAESATSPVSGFDGVQEVRIIGLDGAGDRLLSSEFEDVKTVWLHSWTDPDEILIHLLWPDTSTELVLLPVREGGIRTILEGDPNGFGSFARSPDGRYLLHTPIAEGTSERDIAVLDLETGRETVVVAHEANAGEAAWLPDGSGIIYHSDQAGTMGLWRLRVQGGAPRDEPVLVQHLEHQQLQPLGLASDGSWYYSIDADPWDVVEATFDTDLETPAVTARLPRGLREGSRSPSWSASGHQLAYISRSHRGQAVVVQDRTTGEEREFPMRPLDVFGGVVRWLPDDSALGLLVLSMVDYTNELRVIDPRTGQLIRQRPLGSIDELGEIRDFDWLTKDVIVFLRRRQVVVLDVVTGIEHLAYTDDTAQASAITLSPDRTLVAMSTQGDGIVSIHVMPSRGGAAAFGVSGWSGARPPNGGSRLDGGRSRALLHETRHPHL